jgi:hypothetical protein
MKRICADINLFPKRAPSTTVCPELFSCNSFIQPAFQPTLSEVQEDDSSEHILNLNQLVRIMHSVNTITVLNNGVQVISDGDEDINGEQGNSTLQSLQQSV